MKIGQVVRSRKLLGTVITIKIPLEPTLHKSQIGSALTEAFNEFHRIDASYSRFSESSEITRLNRSAGTKVEISKELAEIIKFQLELAEITKGKFDPTITDLLEESGYYDTFSAEKILQRQSSQKLTENITQLLNKRRNHLALSVIKVENRYYLIRTEGQKIDLGSVGKGWAMDLAAERIASFGIKNFLIEAGGDILASGFNASENRPWRVELLVKNIVDGKFETFTLGELELDSGVSAIASSGSWARSAGTFHHLLDPDSGKPVNSALQTFIIAKNAFIADGIATALFLAGENILEKLVKKYNCEAVYIAQDLSIYTSHTKKLQYLLKLSH